MPWDCARYQVMVLATWFPVGQYYKIIMSVHCNTLITILIWPEMLPGTGIPTKQCNNTIKVPWVRAITSRYLPWYELWTLMLLGRKTTTKITTNMALNPLRRRRKMTITHSLIHSLTHSLTHSRTHSLTHALTVTHSRTHLLTHLLIYSLTHLLTYSLTPSCPASMEVGWLALRPVYTFDSTTWHHVPQLNHNASSYMQWSCNAKANV